MTPPTSVSQLYPEKWIKAVDLNGKTPVVKIVAVKVEEVRQFDGSKETKAILSFEKATRRMILNKTRCKEFGAEIAESENFSDWIGLTIQLSPTTARNGKPTIAIQRPVNGE